MSRNKGFTLVELLVALAIFALLSAFAFRGLNAMLESRAALERESRKWRDVTLFVGRLERDLSAVILTRQAKGSSGTKLPAVSSTIESTEGRDGLSLTRSGAVLLENALAAPQRIAYRRVADRIERLSWASVDAGPREEPIAVPLLADVASLGFRFLDARGEWRTTWGSPGATEPPPNAVEVTLRLASGERIVRLFDLPRAVQPGQPT